MVYYNLMLVLLAGLSNSAVSRQCFDNEVKCGSGDCVQKSKWCNGFADCMDNSDELRCDRNLGSSIDIGTDVVNKTAVKKAADFLLSQRNSYGNWDTFTPRAVIALMFASKASAISEEEQKLMQMQLDMNLLFTLMENKAKMSLSCLALYIQGLYATCQDPRQFHGIDLVARLRSETDASIRRNASIPVAYLSLCIAGSLTNVDKHEMVELYRKNAGKTGSRALVIMAMICYLRSHPRDSLENIVNHFLSIRDVSNEDVYSKFLLLQALTARNKIHDRYSTSTETKENLLLELKQKQQLDGSYGDLLATYYAIPSLLNSSLLDLKCDGLLNTGHQFENFIPAASHRFENLIRETELIYSIWIPSGNDMRSHSLSLKFNGVKTLYDIMLMAAKRDPLFRFSVDESKEGGKVVYSIGGVPNDVESGRSWVLYSGTNGEVHMNSDQNLRQEIKAVDKIQAVGKHYVFWWKRNEKFRLSMN